MRTVTVPLWPGVGVPGQEDGSVGAGGSVRARTEKSFAVLLGDQRRGGENLPVCSRALGMKQGNPVRVPAYPLTLAW